MRREAAGGQPVLIDRREGVSGELCLRRRGAHYEIISNGVFLMSTTNGASEHALVDEAMRRAAVPRRVLIAGLGVGYSLARACQCAQVERITLVEIEAAVIEWHERYFAQTLGSPLRDPRVEVVEADLADRLAEVADIDVLCLDVDNAPDWTARSANDRLYTSRGLATLAGALSPGGVLAVWSAHEHRPFRQRLERRFVHVETVEVPAAQGAPDVIYLARAARP